jgi:hypothetical protein
MKNGLLPGTVERSRCVHLGVTFILLQVHSCQRVHEFIPVTKICLYNLEFTTLCASCGQHFRDFLDASIGMCYTG